MTLKQEEIKEIDHSNSGFTLQHNLMENVLVRCMYLQLSKISRLEAGDLAG
jgi:hypothetical protein